MSNLGLERYLETLGLVLRRTRVGDRYVVDCMRAEGFNLGGEQSGHIILADHGTTGDGLVAALQILALAVGEGLPVSEVCHRFEPLPQILRNVRYAGASPLDDPGVDAATQTALARLGDRGRLVIRPSGTEPLIRVMGEGDDEALVHAVVDDVVTSIETAVAAS